MRTAIVLAVVCAVGCAFAQEDKQIPQYSEEELQLVKDMMRPAIEQQEQNAKDYKPVKVLEPKKRKCKFLPFNFY